jgi:hypothetical protein
VTEGRLMDGGPNRGFESQVHEVFSSRPSARG